MRTFEGIQVGCTEYASYFGFGLSFHAQQQKMLLLVE